MGDCGKSGEILRQRQYLFDSDLDIFFCFFFYEIRFNAEMILFKTKKKQKILFGKMMKLVQ